MKTPKHHQDWKDAGRQRKPKWEQPSDEDDLPFLWDEEDKWIDRGDKRTGKTRKNVDRTHALSSSEQGDGDPQ